MDQPARYHSPRSERAAPDTAGPAAAAKIARLGCLVMVVVWGMGLVSSAAAWIPELIDEVRPVVEKLIAKWEAAQGADRPETTVDQAPQPLPEPPSTPSTDDAPPSGCAPGDPMCTPHPAPDAPAQDPGQTGLALACERTVQCCLTVQGERARSICENFRRMPTVEPCLQAYEAFAQVGSQLGRTCQQ